MSIRWMRSQIWRELVRFLFAGLIVTFFSASIYLIVAGWFGVEPLLANFDAYLAGALLGYRIHFHWTFSERTQPQDSGHANGRFLTGSSSALLLNSFWTWMLTDLVSGPVWLPVLPMIFITPLLSFQLNKRWVFARVTAPAVQ